MLSVKSSLAGSLQAYTPEYPARISAQPVLRGQGSQSFIPEPSFTS